MSDEHTHEEEDNPDGSFGKAVGRGILIGLPAGVIGIIGILWLTSGDFAEAFATGILPGVLFGVFAGGFVGTVKGMSALH